MGTDMMEERSRRIVESAIELAQEGGFEAVRVRDIAAHAKVALGTLYKRFASKEDILVAVLEHEVELLETLMTTHPAVGGTALERLSRFFGIVTAGLCAKPKLARAVLRATASGEPELTEKVARFHDRMTGLITEAFLGRRGEDDQADDIVHLSDDDIQRFAFLLSQIWFAALVGWMGGLFDQNAVVEQVRIAGSLLLRGMRPDDQ